MDLDVHGEDLDQQQVAMDPNAASQGDGPEDAKAEAKEMDAHQSDEEAEAMKSDEEPDLDGPNIPKTKRKKPKGLAGKNFFLTYSQISRIGFTPDDIIKHLKDENRYGPVHKIMWAEEKHQDGGLHIHVLVAYQRKQKTSDMRHFDVVKGNVSCHPNIKPPNVKGRAVKSWVEAQQDYLMKWGKYTNQGYEMEPIGRNNFTKRMQDYSNWVSRCEEKAIGEPWPFSIKFKISNFIVAVKEYYFKKPLLGQKKCHFILKGPPNIGKTYKLTQAMGNNCYLITKQDERGQWDGYKGQHAIVFDDILPSRHDLTDLTTESEYPRPLPARYFNKKRPGKVQIFITCNEAEYQAWKCKDDEAIKARFNLLDLTALDIKYGIERLEAPNSEYKFETP